MYFEIIVFLGCFAIQIQSQESTSSTFFSYPKDKTPNLKFRIIGGDVVTPQNLYPFQVALNVRHLSSMSLCGGSLITEEWVLTAAHCVDNNPLYADVILGAHNLADSTETTRQMFRATTYYIHPGWDDTTRQNDIALIKLPQNATLNENVGLITVATGIDTYAGLNGTILGWGITETGVTSSLLRQVSVEIMTNTDCMATNVAYNETPMLDISSMRMCSAPKCHILVASIFLYGCAHPVRLEIIQNSHLCTSGVGIRGSCNGDSGGPLVTNNILVGLVSFGPETCTLGFPSVFTRVTSFSDWMIETMLTAGATKLNVQVFVLSCLIIVILL